MKSRPEGSAARATRSIRERLARSSRRRPLESITPTPPIRSPRAAEVARLFGLPIGGPADPPADATPPMPPSQPQAIPSTPFPGEITLLTGASGSGKSTLLRAIALHLREHGCEPIDLARLVLPDVPVVDCLPQRSIESALQLLGRLGLGEAWTYLRTPMELSDGQRWRLRLAVALDQAERIDRPAVIICDEFAALLDRLTAAIVAKTIRKLVSTSRFSLAAVLATSHDDVTRPLRPDRVIRCDFGHFLVPSPSTLGES